jgi:hypothetical protein
LNLEGADALQKPEEVLQKLSADKAEITGCSKIYQEPAGRFDRGAHPANQGQRRDRSG